MKDYKSKLQPDRFYHIYNRANGSERMFRNNENYAYFLRRYKKYIDPIVKTYAYCLMPNHFHLLVQVRDEDELWEAYDEKLRTDQRTNLPGATIDSSARTNLRDFANLEGFATRQFSNFFNSYAKAYNKQFNRKGSLFMHTYKRLPITTQSQLQRTIIYIHQNPVKAKLAIFPEDWKFGSYKELISKDSSWLMKNECLELFDDLENFVRCHKP